MLHIMLTLLFFADLMLLSPGHYFIFRYAITLLRRCRRHAVCLRRAMRRSPARRQADDATPPPYAFAAPGFTWLTTPPLRPRACYYMAMMLSHGDACLIYVCLLEWRASAARYYVAAADAGAAFAAATLAGALRHAARTDAAYCRR